MDHRLLHHQIYPAPPSLTTATTSSSSADSWDASWSTAAAPPPQPEKEELTRALLHATLELELTRAAAHEELRKMELLLKAATQERDESRLQYQSLLLLMDHHIPTNPNPNSSNPSQAFVVVGEVGNVGVPASSSSSSSAEERSDKLPSPPVVAAEMEAAAERRGLPEKGRLVEAVMEAGPLLQTLLLAGPLPEWRHPPPVMQSFEITPVSIPQIDGQKSESASPSSSPPIYPVPSYSPEDNSSNSKYQRINRFLV